MKGRNRRPALVAYALSLLMGVLLILGSALEALAANESGISSEFSHLVLSQQGGKLRVFQLVKLKNSGSAAVSPVKVALPQGYANLSFPNQPGSDKLKSDTAGVTDPEGLAGGATKDYTLVYELPFPAQGTTVSFKFDYATDQVYVLADQNTLQVLPTQNGDWEYGGAAQMGSKQFEQFARQSVAPGAVLKLTLGPAPAGKPGEPGQGNAGQGVAGQGNPGSTPLLNKFFHGGSANVMLWQRFTGLSGHGGLVGMLVILLGLGLVVAGVGTWLYRRYRKGGEAAAPSPLVSNEDLVARLSKEKALYVKKIAELDRLLSQKAIDPQEHAQKRSVYKQRLARVIVKLKELQS
ncbi:MAG: hypothetical protein M1602_05435 [Firmicutes bacterium]|nr:hypothetical protein [Bacillota bacterium]